MVTPNLITYLRSQYRKSLVSNTEFVFDDVWAHALVDPEVVLETRSMANHVISQNII
jgi:hypothetical protein